MQKRIDELLLSGKSVADVVRIVSNETGKSKQNIRYHVNKIKDRNKALRDECEEKGIDFNSVNYYWYKSEKFSINATPNEAVDYEKIINDILEQKYQKLEKKQLPEVETFDRLVFTDTHVGMDASRKGVAMYAEEWGGEMLFQRIEEMANKMLSCKRSSVLYIDDLGDYMDGFNGMTTRGGHKLPQNMTNEEAFDTGLKAKLMLVDLLSKEYEFITFNNVCNDNHSASFGYTVNSAFKQICDVKYNNVEVVNHLKFMSHYVVGNHAFVITHGKDDRHMKYGFKPILDAKQVYKIDQFLKNEGIYREAKYIEISKGDSHQCLFDMCTSDDFHYFNFAAFSPSSEWVQLNFTKGRSGFTILHIDKYTPNKSIFPYFFNNN